MSEKEEKKEEKKEGGPAGKKKANPFVILLIIVLAGFAIAIFASAMFGARMELTWTRDFIIETILRFIGPAIFLLILGGVAMWIMMKK